MRWRRRCRLGDRFRGGRQVPCFCVKPPRPADRFRCRHADSNTAVARLAVLRGYLRFCGLNVTRIVRAVGTLAGIWPFLTAPVRPSPEHSYGFVRLRKRRHRRDSEGGGDDKRLCDFHASYLPTGLGFVARLSTVKGECACEQSALRMNAFLSASRTAYSDRASAPFRRGIKIAAFVGFHSPHCLAPRNAQANGVSASH